MEATREEVKVTDINAPAPRPIEELGKVSTEELVEQLRGKVLNADNLGIRRLTRIFQAIDKHGDGGIDLDDFRWAFIDYGFQVSKEDSAMVLAAFDKQALEELRDIMVALDKDGDGLVTKGELKRHFTQLFPGMHFAQARPTLQE